MELSIISQRPESRGRTFRQYCVEDINTIDRLLLAESLMLYEDLRYQGDEHLSLEHCNCYRQERNCKQWFLRLDQWGLGMPVVSDGERQKPSLCGIL